MSIKPFTGLRSRFLAPRRPSAAVPLQLCWLRPRFLVVQTRPLHLQVNLNLSTVSTHPATLMRTTQVLPREILRLSSPTPGRAPFQPVWPARWQHYLVERRQHTLRLLQQSTEVQFTQVHQAAPPGPVARQMLLLKRLEMVVKREAGAPADKRTHEAAQRETVSQTVHWSTLAPARAPAGAAAGGLELTPPLLNRITDEVVRSIDRRMLSYRERMGRI
jgi:hypothetical protein